MIEFTTGNILRSEAEALVNTVNCVGIMGRGIALQFKNAFPDNFAAYAAACAAKLVNPGHMFVFDTGRLTPRFVINFPTKRHWKGKSRVEDIESGLEDLVRVVRERRIRSIAIPPLGAGLGGLDWIDVRARIEAAMVQLPDVAITVFEPSGAPDAQALARNKRVPNMSPGRAALVVLLQRYLNGLMDPFVTLIEAHKLMYFLQAAGENLQLDYKKHHYGPYAPTLRHVFKDIEGHLVTGYSDGGDEPTKQLELVPGAYDDAERFLSDRNETRSRFDKVADLVEGFETPYGLELLATVHWCSQHDGASTPQETIECVHAWSERKRRFSPDQIEIAWQTLLDKGWIGGAAQPH